jgi:hypothetical protein
MIIPLVQFHSGFVPNEVTLFLPWTCITHIECAMELFFPLVITNMGSSKQMQQSLTKIKSNGPCLSFWWLTCKKTG